MTTNADYDQKLHSPQNMATIESLPGISVYLLDVTPELAEEMLDINSSKQRTLTETTVERYATDMSTFDWIFNGAPILITNTNVLIDGQHRLSAIVASGEPQTLLIVHGVDEEAMATVDNGRRRSYGDVLKMRGLKHHAVVAALTARVWHFYHGNYGARGVPRVANPTHSQSLPTNAQRDYWMKQIEAAFDITFEQAAGFGTRMFRNRRGISSITWALAWVILSGVDKDLREKFFWEMDLDRKSGEVSRAVMALLNRLGNLKARETWTNVDQLHLILSAYNHWVNGEDPTTITIPRKPISHKTLAMPVDFQEPKFS